MKGERLLDAILELSPKIRYAALHLGGGEPLLRERAGVAGMTPDSERWDELVVNPVLIELARRRGDVDCGGLHHVLVTYHRFHNLVVPVDGGHLSVVVELDGDPLALAPAVRDAAKQHGVAMPALP